MSKARNYDISPQIDAQIGSLSEESAWLAYDAVKKSTLAGWAWQILGLSLLISMSLFIIFKGEIVLPSELIAVTGLVVALWLLWPFFGRDDSLLAYMERLSQLPFELRGYVESLGTDHRTLETVYHAREWINCVVTIKFVHDDGGQHPPARAALEIEDPYRIQEIGEREISLTVQHIMKVGHDTRYGWRYDGNQKLCRWFTKFLAQTLLPLHAQSPIESVQVMLVNEHHSDVDPLEYN